MRQIEVAFCGNSVYLSGLAASLRQSEWLRVSQVDASPGEALNDLKLLRPEVVVGEFAGLGAVDAIRAENLGLLVIAVEAATDSMVIFAGRTPERAPVAELARLIMEGVPAGENAAGADGRKGMT